MRCPVNRRNFFALLLAPLVARFVPKPKPLSPVEYVNWKMTQAQQRMSEILVAEMYNYPRATPRYYFVATDGRYTIWPTPPPEFEHVNFSMEVSHSSL